MVRDAAPDKSPERVILALHGNQHAVGCDERVDGEHIERQEGSR